MSRVKIELPEKFDFKTSYKVRVGDINYGGHVGNDAILSIMQEGRLEYLQSLGFKDEVSIAENIGIIMTDSAVVYKAESFLGDVLEINVATSDYNKYGGDFNYLLKNIHNDKVIAQGKTGFVCYDYHLKKLVPTPHILEQKLKEGK